MKSCIVIRELIDVLVKVNGKVDSSCSLWGQQIMSDILFLFSDYSIMSKQTLYCTISEWSEYHFLSFEASV